MTNASETGELDARIAAYELAFRMQTQAPELVDLSAESASTKRLYGMEDPVAEPFVRSACWRGEWSSGGCGS